MSVQITAEMLVDGKLVGAADGATFDVVNPATEEVIGSVADGGPDEVEAALDDVNLRRFLGVVRKLAGETQFVLITHQQPTVEIADTLFGVTMGSDGASQILSRKLARTVEGPAKPYVRRQLKAISGGRA